MDNQPQPKKVFSCATCLFAVNARVNRNDITPILQCRRFPLTALLVHTSQGPMPASGHPPTNAQEWCWEYTPLREGEHVRDASDAPEVTEPKKLS